MKLKLGVAFLATTLLSSFTYGSVANAAAPTGYEYTSSAVHYVKVTKTKPVYRVLIGKDEADNRFTKVGFIKKGTKLYASDWIMSTGGGYVVTSKHHWKPTKKTFYFVFNQEQKGWFK